MWKKIVKTAHAAFAAVRGYWNSLDYSPVFGGIELDSSVVSITIGIQRVPFTFFEIVGDDGHGAVIARGRMLLSDYAGIVLPVVSEVKDGAAVVVHARHPAMSRQYHAILSECAFSFKGPAVACDDKVLEKEVVIVAASLHERGDGDKWALVAGKRREPQQDPSAHGQPAASAAAN